MEFLIAYRSARRQVVQQGIVQLQKNISVAVITLMEIMKDSEAPPSSRVSAAKTVIETGLRVTEFELLEERVEEIEKIMRERRR